MRRKVLQHVTPGKVFIRSEIYSELCGVFPEITVCILAFPPRFFATWDVASLKVSAVAAPRRENAEKRFSQGREK